MAFEKEVKLLQLKL